MLYFLTFQFSVFDNEQLEKAKQHAVVPVFKTERKWPIQ